MIDQQGQRAHCTLPGVEDLFVQYDARARIKIAFLSFNFSLCDSSSSSTGHSLVISPFKKPEHIHFLLTEVMFQLPPIVPTNQERLLARFSRAEGTYVTVNGQRQWTAPPKTTATNYKEIVTFSAFPCLVYEVGARLMQSPLPLSDRTRWTGVSLS